MARTPEEQTTDKPVRKKDPSKAPKHTNINTIIRQRQKNPLLSIHDQAKLNGITPSALTRLLQRHGIDHRHVEDYKAAKADLLAGKQEMVLSHITEDSIKRMLEKAPMAAVTLFNSCFNAERLERGQSTNNTSVFFHVIAEAPDLPGETTTSCGATNSADTGVREIK